MHHRHHHYHRKPLLFVYAVKNADYMDLQLQSSRMLNEGVAEVIVGVSFHSDKMFYYVSGDRSLDGLLDTDRINKIMSKPGTIEDWNGIGGKLQNIILVAVTARDGRPS